MVYPNGLRKSVWARSPHEAGETVANDPHLKHDVTVWRAGRIVAVVRLCAGKHRHVTVLPRPGG